MHPGIIAERKANAQARINNAAEKIAKKLKLDIDPASLDITGRDQLVVDMLKTEATADLLEAIAKSGKPAKEKAEQEPEVIQENEA